MASLISSKICHRARISYQTISPECEILVLEITLPGCAPLSIVNTYFPAGIQDVRTLEVTMDYCKKNTLFAGDFNSHHVAWGFRTDASGKRLWDWASSNNFTCLNTKVATFVRCQSRSVLDLSFASSTLSFSSWAVVDDATNSDHRPILMDTVCPLISLDNEVHVYVDYSKFKKTLQSTLSSLTGMERDTKAMRLCSVLKGTLKKSEFAVPKAKGSSGCPWWNPDCARDYRRRKAAWKKLLLNQCPTNWSNYTYAAAMFKRTVSLAKSNYDENRYNYLSKSGNKKALFRFLRFRNAIPTPVNIDSVILSPKELSESLEKIARGLENRFTAQLQMNFVRIASENSFINVTFEELSDVMRVLPASAPGPDGITTSMLKILFDVSPQDLLSIINYSLKNSWIPPDWRLAKILPYLKTRSGFAYGQHKADCINI